MISFSELDKSRKNEMLPLLFGILYSNMHSVAPSGMSYQEEKERYIATVSSALDRETRRILLCRDNGIIASFIQYCTTSDTLMIEEVQLAESLQGTLTFRKMCSCLTNSLPSSISYIEAYADKRNIRSQELMIKAGMKQTDEACGSSFLQFHGDAPRIISRFRL